MSKYSAGKRKSPELGDPVKGSPVSLPVNSATDFSNLIKMIFNFFLLFLKKHIFSSFFFFFLFFPLQFLISLISCIDQPERK